MINQFKIMTEPFYAEHSNEKKVFESAWEAKIPVILKGPTGSGKTRFIEYMAWKLGIPLITISCHEDMTGSDLLGRFLLDNKGTKWFDGPLTMAVRHGAICYLDEIVEARQDTTVIIHSVTDHRRTLSLEKTNEMLEAHDNFFLVISYNPGYQSVLKDLKESTKQRFLAIDISYPEATVEQTIIKVEGNVSDSVAQNLVHVGRLSRNLVGKGLKEGASTRCLIAAATLISKGFSFSEACDASVTNVLSDDKDIRDGLRQAINHLI